MPANGRSCSRCAFYGPLSSASGSCRLLSPTIEGPRDSQFGHRVSRRGLWPIVEADDWCGQFAGTPNLKEAE